MRILAGREKQKEIELLEDMVSVSTSSSTDSDDQSIISDYCSTDNSLIGKRQQQNQYFEDLELNSLEDKEDYEDFDNYSTEFDVQKKLKNDNNEINPNISCENEDNKAQTVFGNLEVLKNPNLSKKNQYQIRSVRIPDVSKPTYTSDRSINS